MVKASKEMKKLFKSNVHVTDGDLLSDEITVPEPVQKTRMGVQ